ncbi:replication initiator [Microtetraspora malaysiensis]|uniref:replication initiator n=1 Tax=Microtetraspora malaysiensis TaxID=161358 RepID=UPI003D93C4E0
MLQPRQSSSCREIPLRQWAHMLGYRGHFSTESRLYSVTLGDFRQAWADHRAKEARESRMEGCGSAVLEAS